MERRPLMMKFARCSFGLALILTLGVMILPASAQVTCAAYTGVAPILRSDGLADPVGDYLLDCTGGLPTVAGFPVPQINLTIVLNTVATGKITAVDGAGTNYTEALALVDEPNTSQYGP